MLRLLSVALVAALFVVPALAQVTVQMQCGDREKLIATLEGRYGEQKVGIGLDNRGPIVEVFANPETGTWTALLTPPDAPLSCILAAGEGWDTLTLRPSGDDA